jgi:DNA-binding XRE family transcriptional regulator|tara:strand:- start:736 stop:1173 length:438 start_codon:yes stop_codon:yes gene_type:complete
VNKNSENNYISHNIKYLRSEKNLGQDEFAGIFDVSRDVIGTYERGKATPKLETIMAICEYFKISIDDFINRDLSKIQDVVYGHYEKDPLIGLMAQEKAGSMQNAGYVNMINDLRGRIEDKERIIKMLEAEIKRLKGNEDYNAKTA